MSYRDREKSTAHELFEEAALRVFDTRQANESTKFDQHVTSCRSPDLVARWRAADDWCSP